LTVIGKEDNNATHSVLSSRIIVVMSIAETAILFAYGTFETFVPLAAQKAGIRTAAIGIMLSAQVLTLPLTKPYRDAFRQDTGGNRKYFMEQLWVQSV